MATASIENLAAAIEAATAVHPLAMPNMSGMVYTFAGEGGTVRVSRETREGGKSEVHIWADQPGSVVFYGPVPQHVIVSTVVAWLGTTAGA